MSTDEYAVAFFAALVALASYLSGFVAGRRQGRIDELERRERGAGGRDGYLLLREREAIKAGLASELSKPDHAAACRYIDRRGVPHGG